MATWYSLPYEVKSIILNFHLDAVLATPWIQQPITSTMHYINALSLLSVHARHFVNLLSACPELYPEALRMILKRREPSVEYQSMTIAQRVEFIRQTYDHVGSTTAERRQKARQPIVEWDLLDKRRRDIECKVYEMI